jgi:hypothetical protein
MNGFDVDTRERVWVDGDSESKRAFFEEVKATKAGAQYFAYYASPENHELVIEGVCRLNPEIEYISVSAFVDAIGALIDAGELTPTHVPEALAPAAEPTPVPVDKNGRVLTQAQIKWSEMTQFANQHSMREINERKRIDSVFADFIRTNLRRDMQQEIDGDARPTNPHLEQRRTPTQAALKDQRLVEFAKTYRLMSAEDVRKARRFDISPLTAAQFRADEDQAIKLGLL